MRRLWAPDSHDLHRDLELERLLALAGREHLPASPEEGIVTLRRTCFEPRSFSDLDAAGTPALAPALKRSGVAEPNELALMKQSASARDLRKARFGTRRSRRDRRDLHRSAAGRGRRSPDNPDNSRQASSRARSGPEAPPQSLCSAAPCGAPPRSAVEREDRACEVWERGE